MRGARPPHAAPARPGGVGRTGRDLRPAALHRLDPLDGGARHRDGADPASAHDRLRGRSADRRVPALGEARAARGAVEPGSSATTDTGSRPSTCAAASRPCPTRSRAAGPGLTGPRAAPHPGRGGAIAPMTRTGEPDRLAARGGPPSDCGIGGQARRQRPRQVRQTPSGSVIPRGIRSRRVLWRKPDTSRRRVVETTGIEPVTFPMSRECTTAVLRLLIDHDQVHRTWTPSR